MDIYRSRKNQGLNLTYKLRVFMHLIPLNLIFVYRILEIMCHVDYEMFQLEKRIEKIKK